MAILGFFLIFLITSFTTSKLIFLDPSDFFKYFKYFENLHALAICVIFLGLMLERSMNKLVLTYRTADDAAVEQLVKAAFRMANSFVSCSAVHEVLTRVGVSAKILRKNKIMVKFLNPVEILANDDPSYAYSWIDPGFFDLYTVIRDSAILNRCRTLSAMEGGSGIKEMN